MSMIQVANPFSLNPIGSVETSTWADINNKLETAYGLYRDRNTWLPAYQRIEILNKAAGLMRDRFDELAYLIADEGGKPLVDARVEVTRAIDGMGLCAQEIGQMAGREIPMDLTKAGAGRVALPVGNPLGL